MPSEHGFNLSGNAAELYQKVLVPAWLGQWAEALVDYARVKPGWNVLDAACGTGVVARTVERSVEEVGSIYGIDVNKQMLEIASSFSDSRGLIQWIERDVSATKLESNSIDVVLSQQGLQYFPNKLGALNEMHRVLRTGGKAYFSLWHSHSIYTSTLVEALTKYISEEAGKQQDESRNTPDSVELEELMLNAGFKEVVVTAQELDICTPDATTFIPRHMSSMPFGAIFNSKEESKKKELINYVSAKLAVYEIDGQLKYKDKVNIVSGKK